MSKRGRSTGTDVGWAIFSAAAAVVGAASVLNVVVAVVTRAWFQIVLGLGYVLASVWFALGAWRRTSWGHRPDREPAPPPEIGKERALQYSVVGAACVVAAALALAVQVISART